MAVSGSVLKNWEVQPDFECAKWLQFRLKLKMAFLEQGAT